MRLHRLAAVCSIPAILVLAAVAACGGGDDDDSAANRGNGATATAGGGNSAAATAKPTATQNSGGQESSADAVDACSLITKDEAETALGQSVSDGKNEDFAPIYACTYNTAGFDEVSVSVFVFDSNDQAKEGFQQAIDFNDYPEVEGIGEGAYYALGFGTSVLKDKYEITIHVLGPDNDQDLEKDLAAKAVKRLP